MKKITLFLCLISFSLSQAAIIVKDITDFTFTPDSSLAFDFNSDGTAEFTFEEMGNVGVFYNSTNVNFIGHGTIASGYGWDVIKFLTAGTSISSTSLFAGEGDAYINPFWAHTSDIFPSGDSYIGTKFKIGAATYYGWILVSSTGGASGIITVKSYAYNNVANGSITAGQTLSSADFTADFNLKAYPNPTKAIVHIQTEKNIIYISVSNITGAVFKVNLLDNTLDLSPFSAGIYFLNVVSDANERSVVKIIKE